MNAARTAALSLGIFAGLLVSTGCEGQGVGSLDGTLFVRACPKQGSDDPTGMPAPLPPFSLAPTFFSAEPSWPMAPTQNLDMRDVRRLAIRAQRDGERPERTDGLLLFVTDVEAVRQRLGQPLPIIAAPLSGPDVPLPPVPSVGVKAALYLSSTCPFARAQPYLTGTVTFTALGFELGEPVAATITATVSDPRGVRAGLPAVDQDAAGQLSGSLSLTVQAGPASHTP